MILILQRKCEEYFALVAGEVRTIDNLTISTTNVKHCIDFDIREMEISKVTHYTVHIYTYTPLRDSNHTYSWHDCSYTRH